MCLIVCYKSLCFIMVSQLFIYIYIYISMMSIYQLSFICFKCFTILIDFCLRSFSSYGIEKWIDSHLNLAPLNPSWSPNLATSLGESVKLWNRHGEIANLRNPHLLRKTHQIGSLGHWVIGSLGHWVGSIFGDPPGFSGENTHGVRWTLVTLAAKPWRLLSTSHSVDLRQVRGWRRWASTHWISSGLSDWALPW